MNDTTETSEQTLAIAKLSELYAKLNEQTLAIAKLSELYAKLTTKYGSEFTDVVFASYSAHRIINKLAQMAAAKQPVDTDIIDDVTIMLAIFVRDMLDQRNLNNMLPTVVAETNNIKHELDEWQTLYEAPKGKPQ